MGFARLEDVARRGEGFGKAMGRGGGEGQPRIVFEHPGQDTIPTSNFVCDRGGMIVIAGTTGYDTLIDVRYLCTSRSATRAPTSSTTSRPRRSTTWCAKARSVPRSATRTPTRRPASRTN